MSVYLLLSKPRRQEKNSKFTWKTEYFSEINLEDLFRCQKITYFALDYLILYCYSNCHLKMSQSEFSILFHSSVQSSFLPHIFVLVCIYLCTQRRHPLVVTLSIVFNVLVLQRHSVFLNNCIISQKWRLLFFCDSNTLVTTMTRTTMTIATATKSLLSSD